MDHPPEIEQYVKNPDLLLELIRDVIKFLESEDDRDETKAMVAQLREISKLVERLEKKCIAVPDVLRAEKTRLAASLGSQSASLQVLNHLADGLDEIIKNLKARIGSNVGPSSRKRIAKKHSSSPKTDDKTLRALIVDALQHLGGSAHLQDVLKYMGEQLDGKLLPGDLEWRASARQYAWQNKACWERYKMTQDGILKTNSPSGYWELNEEYK